MSRMMVVYSCLFLHFVYVYGNEREGCEKKRRKLVKLLFVVLKKKRDSGRKRCPTLLCPVKKCQIGLKEGSEVILVVSRQSTSDALVFALAHALPALLVLVHSNSEALEVTEAIKPDAFVLESTLEGLSGVDLCNRLQSQPGFAKIPAVLIGMLSPEQHRSIAKRTVVNLPYTFEPNDLPSALETLLNIPKAPMRPDTIEVIEHNRSSVA